MKIYRDLSRTGIDDTVYILKRVLTFVYMDEILEPKISVVLDMLRVTYKVRNINIALDLSLMMLEGLNITLEQFSLDMKKQVISQYRSEIDKVDCVRGE